MNDLMEPFRVRCRCVACGKITYELSTYAPDRKRFTKSWFCGCAPKPDGSPMDANNQQLTGQKT